MAEFTIDQIDKEILNQDGRIGKGLAELVTQKTEEGDGLMNVTKLMDIMNKAGAESGAEVQHKMRSEDGNLVLDADEKDVERCNFEMQMAQLARMVEHLPRGEKMAFSKEMRLQGNDKFNNHDYESASELYMQSLVGLDFGNNENTKNEAILSIQIPILNNLMACSLKLRKFYRCIILSEYAIKLDYKNESWKSYSRKGIAYLELGEFHKARACLRDASRCANINDIDLKSIRIELKRVQDYEKITKLETEKHRKALSSAMNSDCGSGLYVDKKKKLVSTIDSSHSSSTTTSSSTSNAKNTKQNNKSKQEKTKKDIKEEDAGKSFAQKSNNSTSIEDLNKSIKQYDNQDDQYETNFNIQKFSIPQRLIILCVAVLCLSYGLEYISA